MDRYNTGDMSVTYRRFIFLRRSFPSFCGQRNLVSRLVLPQKFTLSAAAGAARKAVALPKVTLGKNAILPRFITLYCAALRRGKPDRRPAATHDERGAVSSCISRALSSLCGLRAHFTFLPLQGKNISLLRSSIRSLTAHLYLRKNFTSGAARHTFAYRSLPCRGGHLTYLPPSNMR